MKGFGEDFGQKVDLTASIRNILRNYPEGTSIFKELIQNADDAGARKVRLILDHRHHPSAKIADQSLAQFQGPSLLVYNDAVFTEEDFESIKRIGDSLKNQGNENKTKIGRFGIGFNAVYHWTEIPSFMSDKYLVLLDPQARFLPNVSPANPGTRVNFIANKEVVSIFEDQFTPYKIPELDFASPFQGTLFRLPLRTTQQAESSFLSKRALSVNDVREVLLSLVSEANHMLLFLRHVEQLEVAEWLENTPEPVLLGSCRIRNIDQVLRSKRSYNSILGKNFGISALKTMIQPIVQDFDIEIDLLTLNGVSTEQWIVCTQFGGEACNRLACDANNAHMKFVPLGGVAVKVGLEFTINHSTNNGLAYCFLPLPIRTNLPVMVNGFFELSSNRRDIWQASTDMTGDGYVRAEWNKSLLIDVIAPSYVRLLLAAKGKLMLNLRNTGQFDDIQFESLWPLCQIMSKPWDLLAENVHKLASSEKLLRVAEFKNDELGTIQSNGSDVHWVEVAKALLLPLAVSEEENEISTYQSELVNFLLKYDQSVVKFNSKELHHSLMMLQNRILTNPIAAPSFVRKIISDNRDRVKYSAKSCRFLLIYCLSDIIVANHPTGGKGKVNSIATSIQSLNNLPLLPLKNGSVGKLTIFSDEQSGKIEMLMNLGYSLQEIFHHLPS